MVHRAETLKGIRRVIFHAGNVDPERSHQNIACCDENIRDVYHELFDEAAVFFKLRSKIAFLQGHIKDACF